MHLRPSKGRKMINSEDLALKIRTHIPCPVSEELFVHPPLVPVLRQVRPPPQAMRSAISASASSVVCGTGWVRMRSPMLKGLVEISHGAKVAECKVEHRSRSVPKYVNAHEHKLVPHDTQFILLSKPMVPCMNLIAGWSPWVTDRAGVFSVL